MRKVLLIILGVTSLSICQAQNSKIKQGEPFGSKSTTYADSFIRIGTDIFTLNYRSGAYLSNTFAYHMDKVTDQTTAISEKIEGKHSMAKPRMIKFQGEIYLEDAGSHYNGVKVVLTKINPADLSVIETITVIDQDFKAAMPIKNVDSEGIVRSASSPNGKYRVYGVQLVGRKKDKAKFEIVLLDDKLKKLYTTEFSRLTNLSAKLSDIVVNDNGEVFISMHQLDDKEVINTIEQVSAEGVDELKQLRLSSKKLHRMRLKLHSNGSLISAGYYYLEDIDQPTGLYYFIMDKDQNEVVETSSDFAKGIFEFGLLDDQDEENNDDSYIEDLVIKEIKEIGDGFLIIGEDYSITERYNTETSVTTYTHYSNDLVLQRISAQGQLEYTRRINKRCSNSRPNITGYSAHVVGDAVHVIFNDGAGKERNLYHNTNAPKKESYEAATFAYMKKSSFYHVTIEKGGELSREAVLENYKENGKRIYRVNNAIYDGNKIYLMGYSRSNRRFDEVVLWD